MEEKEKDMKLPLIRLKIENTGYPVIKSKRIADHFASRIANTMDFLQFYKKTGFISSIHPSKLPNMKAGGDPKSTSISA